MHCNLRLTEVVTVVLSFNYGAHIKFEVSQFLSVPEKYTTLFAADTLRHAVTLIVDSFTLNVCSVLVVM